MSYLEAETEAALPSFGAAQDRPMGQGLARPQGAGVLFMKLYGRSS